MYFLYVNIVTIRKINFVLSALEKIKKQENVFWNTCILCIPEYKFQKSKIGISIYKIMRCIM